MQELDQVCGGCAAVEGTWRTDAEGDGEEGVVEAEVVGTGIDLDTGGHCHDG